VRPTPSKGGEAEFGAKYGDRDTDGPDGEDEQSHVDAIDESSHHREKYERISFEERPDSSNPLGFSGRCLRKWIL